MPFLQVTTIIEDEELGRLVLRVNVRAKSIVFRAGSDAIYVSVPSRVTLEKVSEVIEEMRDKLSASRRKVSRRRIDAERFKLSLITGKCERFSTCSKQGETTIICPPETDFNDEKLQIWLQKVVEEVLRKQAKIILPPRLSTLSVQCKLPFREVKISSGRRRWGSCSAKKVINLSFFTLTLPQHLIDYVLLHELCHTREMNHGDRFWALLDNVTGGKALALRRELGAYKAEIV
jgi:predicted metal-dependent hydrolase